MAETNCAFSSSSSTLDRDVYKNHEEGTVYALYKNCVITTNRSQTIENQKPLIKYDANGNSFVNYYLRTGTAWLNGNYYYSYYLYYTSCIMVKNSYGYMMWNTGQTEEDYINSSQHITSSAFAPGFAI